MSAQRTRSIRPITILGALLLTTAFTVPAFAIETVVVTAEKRSEDVQTVPVAISVFNSEKREQIGITSVQDMTNFTPGLAYQTSLDRVFLRGVGRQTNSQAADTPVANYDDGLYETFAVAAGRSSLDLDRVEILRGPQGTLSGRNALGGAINEVTVRPSTDAFHGEARLTYGAYNHIAPEISLTGPIDDVWAFRVYGLWDYQTQGYSRNIYPHAQQGTNDPLYTGHPSFNTPQFGNGGDGNVINEWYIDAQLQAKFSSSLEMWTKIQSAQWFNGAGGPGADLEGWTPADYPTYEAGQAWPNALFMNPGYGCTAAPGSPYFTPNTTITAGSVMSNLPGAQACTNPGAKNPWTQARLSQTAVRLPSYFSLNSQWTWHTGDFDIKYIVGGSYYRYHLASQVNVSQAPIASYQVSGFNINNNWMFDPEEENSFISNEINFISTTDSPLQWVAGLYQFSQQANQPGDVYNFTQPQVNAVTQAQWGNAGLPKNIGGPAPLFLNLCAATPIFGGNGVGTNGECAPNTTFRVDDSRNNIHDHSYAGFGQIDWQFLDTLKLTAGIRESWDHKNGSETVRVLCYFSFCNAFGVAPENGAFGDLGQVADFTQTGIVVSTGLPTPPKGVVGPTTYNVNTGFAHRELKASWSGLTGTVGLEWQPDNLTLGYIKYSHGYKDGGYYEGANTVINAQPFTKAEHVDSFEAGIKHTFGDWLTANLAIFHYQYENLQLPLSTVTTQGTVTLASSSFYNVPGSISQGVELETQIQPTDDLAILFNYSYNDAHVSKGQNFDIADPDATAPGAQPLVTDAQCLNPLVFGTGTIGPAGSPCYRDTYLPGPAAGGVAFAKIQNLKGNELPNAAKNKIAFNVLYTFHTDVGTITPSLSVVWRDKQYGTLFTRSYNEAPPWYQTDLRLIWVSTDADYEVIVFGKNITNQIAYDTGAIGTRLAGTNFVAANCIGVGTPGGPLSNGAGGCNFVQGVNGPAGYGPVRGANAQAVIKTYQVAPPALWGIEFHYKFD
jgi:iron complex outermembrane receptor protein